MHDALQATKELALDCRTYGTAFRLGVSCLKLIPLEFLSLILAYFSDSLVNLINFDAIIETLPNQYSMFP